MDTVFSFLISAVNYFAKSHWCERTKMYALQS
jgi:hypothetical protein